MKYSPFKDFQWGTHMEYINRKSEIRSQDLPIMLGETQDIDKYFSKVLVPNHSFILYGVQFEYQNGFYLSNVG